MKIPPRGLEPLERNQEPIINTELTKSQDFVLDTSLDILLQKHADLQAVITVWPELPEHIKAAIKALVETHKGKERRKEE